MAAALEQLMQHLLPGGLLLLWGWAGATIELSPESLASLASQDLTDAYLAAVAIAHGWWLVSFDQGFGWFEGLFWLRP